MGGISVEFFVLDDSPVMVKAIAGTFTGLGPVHTATLWSEIGSPLIRSRADAAVLICDLDMPGMRGDEFCEIVRRFKPDCLIVVFAGTVKDELAVADATVAKGQGLLALRAAVLELIASRVGSDGSVPE